MNAGRIIYFTLGVVSLGVGIVGAFLPILPTTIFVIIAAACFARSSTRLEARLLNDPRFGPAIKAWRKDGAIPKRGKILAIVGMTLGYGFFWFSVGPGWMLAAIVAIGMIASGFFVLSRPTAQT